MKYLKILISASLAGICIGIGGTAYLAIDNKLAGAFLFSIGLLVICTAGLKLYTGRIGYIIENKNLLEILIILAGNIIGAGVMGSLIRLCNLTIIMDNVENVVDIKMGRSILSTFILAVLCNICIYIAVEAYKKIKDIGKYLIVILAVMVFIICGFEHSIADIFYYTVYGWDLNEVLYIVVIIIGNAVGGICSNQIYKWAGGEE